MIVALGQHGCVAPPSSGGIIGCDVILPELHQACSSSELQCNVTSMQQFEKNGISFHIDGTCAWLKGTWISCCLVVVAGVSVFYFADAIYAQIC